LHWDILTFSSQNQLNRNLSEKSKNLNFLYFHFFSKLIEISQKLWKFLEFNFFRFFREVAIPLVLRWETTYISAWNSPILIPRPGLERILLWGSEHGNMIWEHYSGLRWHRSRQKVKNLQLGSNVQFVKNQISRFL
jgi:hypothetical protein